MSANERIRALPDRSPHSSPAFATRHHVYFDSIPTAGERMSPSLEAGNVAALGTLPDPRRSKAAGERGPKRNAIAERRRAQTRRISPPPGILDKGAERSVARNAHFVRLRSRKAAFWQDIAPMLTYRCGIPGSRNTTVANPGSLS